MKIDDNRLVKKMDDNRFYFSSIFTLRAAGHSHTLRY
jgi:hypothetical protein